MAGTNFHAPKTKTLLEAFGQWKLSILDLFDDL